MSWGLMQVMGQVAREFGFAEESLPELCDPATGVDVGCLVLAKRLARARGDVPAALLAWNGGRKINYPRGPVPLTRSYFSAGPLEPTVGKTPAPDHPSRT